MRIAVEGAPYINLLSVWLFAGVLLLPPPLLCALIVLGYLHSWARMYRLRALAHRKVFSAATVVLAVPDRVLGAALRLPGDRRRRSRRRSTGRYGLVAVVAAGAAVPGDQLRARRAVIV